jgi:arylsulfatase A-like enzyme
MPANAQLTAWPDTLPKWDSLGAVEKKLFIKQMDVYAAYLAYTDHEIGRVIQAVEDLGQLNNTLIIYISGDNGGRIKTPIIPAVRKAAARVDARATAVHDNRAGVPNRQA